MRRHQPGLVNGSKVWTVLQTRVSPSPSWKFFWSRSRIVKLWRYEPERLKWPALWSQAEGRKQKEVDGLGETELWVLGSGHIVSWRTEFLLSLSCAVLPILWDTHKIPSLPMSVPVGVFPVNKEYKYTEHEYIYFLLLICFIPWKSNSSSGTLADFQSLENIFLLTFTELLQQGKQEGQSQCRPEVTILELYIWVHF